MAGRAAAVKNGDELVRRVVDLAGQLGLRVRTQVRMGRRVWGAKRNIDVVVTHTATRRSLGIECKAQAVGGSAEEKIPATLQDIAAWPMPGLVVFDGEGFSGHWRSFLIATGKVIEFGELRGWLELYFGLDDSLPV